MPTTVVQDLLTVVILLVFGVIIWAGFKKKPVKEVFEDIKEIFKGDEE